LADAVKRFHIPHEQLTAVIDGVEMDLDRRRYETFDELRLYCQRVASAVGGVQLGPGATGVRDADT
jgi:phytoene synthase